MNTHPATTYKVRFHDCDPFGHLNNARFIDYMISARQDHLKERYDFDFADYYKRGFGWVISNHEIQYLKPALFDESIAIQSFLLEVEHDSLFVEIVMYNHEQTHIKAVLRSKLIYVNLKTGKKESHTPEFLAWAKTLQDQEAAQATTLQSRVKTLLEGLRSKHSAV